MFSNMGISDIISFLALILTALGSLIGIIWLVNEIMIKAAIRGLTEKDTQQQRQIDGLLDEAERIEDKLDEEIKNTNKSVETKLESMTNKIDKQQEDINNKLNSFHNDIIERLSKIIEQNSNLEKTILREFINRQTLDRELGVIKHEIESIPCKKFGAAECVGKPVAA